MIRASFTNDELARRLDAVRARMATLGLDFCVLSAPENIYYLTGLDHWGYFASHLLIVPSDGAMVLIARAMERATVANQVGNARFEGHHDHETAADVAVRVLDELRATGGRARIGLEYWSSGLPHGLARALMDGLADGRWTDIGGTVDALRFVKSPAEQDLIRRAAGISDTALDAAIAAIHPGVPERAVAAACLRAMTEAGGAPPGFGPFIRPRGRIGEEHTTWGEGRIAEGEAVFLELSGCVGRYHAPVGRLVHAGEPPRSIREVAAVCLAAFDAALEALRPGRRAREVYAAWQAVVDAAGLPEYRRHHCGYLVGIGVSPSWIGGNRVTGLRHDSDLEIRAGMTFHVMSWLLGTGRGDYFVSDTALVSPRGAELLTRTPKSPTAAE